MSLSLQQELSDLLVQPFCELFIELQNKCKLIKILQSDNQGSSQGCGQGLARKKSWAHGLFLQFGTCLCTTVCVYLNSQI